MPRPPFEPDDEQQKVLLALVNLAAQRQAIEEQIDRLIVEAGRLRVPINRIAEAADLARKTIYRHLGKPMK
ncbi:AcrR family transcriptional regulator [Actinoplanes campanulatus]|uniref:AcrR family transcriptional regulator n=1 Tax=Actinoplanes campanulatus TaxID=113559 RepID=A0A7W5AN07_9ACTN|nr:hypothetical protein [Actinoplanes campanulatus]MBB3099067.1 AcrR family transcriptional regulator [Actinoplanes campanulatus]GGN39194.1 hypothetical protein GCM10010109_66850 [Actinoplanes campanulatus]GID40224.1 hypothetical protein Aca09nite_67300 [Actinoplanes campanulatus]